MAGESATIAPAGLTTPTAKLNLEAKKNGVIDFDAEQLKAKYLEERNKRLNNAGLDQYRNVRTSGLTEFLDDPYADPNFTRAPVDATYETLIIGGGYSGLQAAARLSAQGHSNICIVEKGADYGGTWYWNRYPGAQCDIESYIYMPLLEELGVIPTEKYVSSSELFQHAKNIGQHYGLRSKTFFQTEVKVLKWNQDNLTWIIETNRQDKLRARWVVLCPGPLQTPKFPGIPGIETFEGKSFHSCRWDYDYTGGEPKVPNLNKLSNKRVGIIGTGASAVQIIPHLAKSSGELYVFQRTPSSIDRRGNKVTDLDWWKSITQTKGWQKERQENFTTIISGGQTGEDMVNDGWTDILRSLAGFFGSETTSDDVAAKMQMADFKKMESIRSRIDHIVQDPKTAELLKPWYNQFCKRPCFHDGYLPAFNKPTVHLVDTDGKGVQSVNAKGVVVGGKQYDLDCLIYATGFEWNSDFAKRYGMKIIGRDGLSLSTKWEEGISTFHGWCIGGFPNLTILTHLQAGATPNFTHSIAEMTRHLAYVIDKCKNQGIVSWDATKSAEDEWVQDAVETGKSRWQFLADCTPGYYNDEGRVNEKTLRAGPYSGGTPKWIEIMAKWRQDDKLEGLETVTQA